MVLSERITGMEQDSKPSDAKSDFIWWLLAAALAVILFFAEKTPIWTALLLAFLFALLSHPITQIPWIRCARRRKLTALGFMAFLVVCFGVVVWPRADKGITGAAYEVSIIADIANRLLKLLAETRVRYGLCIVLGMLLMVFFQRVARWIAGLHKREINSRNAEKGFLDYKMQAEDGVNKLGPILSVITKIIIEVGRSVGEHTKLLNGASKSSARIQVKVVQQTAKMLNGYSRKLDQECRDLERIGDSLAEGIEEWLKWMSTQPGGMAAKEEMGSLKEMVEVMDGTLDSINSYLSSIEATRGVSRDMNIAADTHLASITRVRDAIDKIRKSGLEGLRSLDAIEPQK
jgi:hypothetical protein